MIPRRPMTPAEAAAAFLLAAALAGVTLRQDPPKTARGNTEEADPELGA